MAQVYGFLREEKATHGEKMVYKLLKDNLPKEFYVYVECPLPGKRIQRFPDFIVLANYGVVVLEVKDWVHIVKFDRYQAEIRTRDNKIRSERNPTEQARELAIALAEELRRTVSRRSDANPCNVGWGYAVIFPNLPMSVITQLREVWGEEFILGMADLLPDLVTKRLKNTIPLNHIHTLKKLEMDYVRSIINPPVYIEPPNRPPVILDEQQETLVVEPVREATPAQEEKPAAEAQQAQLFTEPSPQGEPAKPHKPVPAAPLGDILAQSSFVRLVRGVAGSGKSLVLTQRAIYLAAQFPEWKIGVLTYNDDLATSLRASVRRYRNIQALTFHKLCSQLLSGVQHWKEPTNPQGWLKRHTAIHPIIEELGTDFLEDEFKWIKDTGITSRDEYLTVERKGRGQQGRLSPQARAKVYAVLEAYNQYLDHEQIPDWADIPYRVLQLLDEGKIDFIPYDAILIDEAQDFAPSWMRVIKRLLKPETGILFLADDPAQSIYRFFSWRQKGVPVVGRTRHLRVPYRNTYEIYRAAYELIRCDEHLMQTLGEDGLLIEPDLTAEQMRHGEKPAIHRFASFDDEMLHLKDTINHLRQRGLNSAQIAVLHRRKKGATMVKQALKGLDVNIDTFHAYKGLEFEYVYLCQIQETFQNAVEKDEIAAERRLVYMAMTRARYQLEMGYEGVIPIPMRNIIPYVDLV